MDINEPPAAVDANHLEPMDSGIVDAQPGSSKTVSITPPPAAGQQIKKSRKRKKQMFNQIRQQIEFYFSDANLSKDRFLKKLMEKNSEVELDVFMTFNKIKAMVTSVEDIEKAISTSEKLVLSADRKRVSRIAEFTESAEPNKSADERTIYVEALPTSASHDWVRKVFEQYGPVAYVSLPRFHTSRQIKEFAFVEFETHASVLKAINSFAKFGGALNMSSDPEKLGSVTAYLREKETEGSPANIDVPLTTNSEGGPKLAEAQQPVQKESVSEEPTAKRVKISSAVSEVVPEISETDTKANQVNQPSELSDNEKIAEATEEELDDEDEAAKKKVRRKKSTSKHPKTSNEQQLDASVNTLRITTKIEWKRLRNKYLNQQRENIKLLNAARRAKSYKSPNDDSKGGSKRNDKINFYGAEKEVADSLVPMEVEHNTTKKTVFARKTVDSKNKKTPVLPFEEGIIVKITFAEPCVDVKDFKSEMRQYPFVRYVDIKEGDVAAFVRVESAGLAPQLVQRTAPLECSILGGAEEKEYWNKIQSDRYLKLTKQLKVKPVRGRTKVVAVESPNPKHVRFGEE